MPFSTETDAQASLAAFHSILAKVNESLIGSQETVVGTDIAPSLINEPRLATPQKAVLEVLIGVTPEQDKEIRPSDRQIAETAIVQTFFSLGLDNGVSVTYPVPTEFVDFYTSAAQVIEDSQRKFPALQNLLRDFVANHNRE